MKPSRFLFPQTAAEASMVSLIKFPSIILLNWELQRRSHVASQFVTHGHLMSRNEEVCGQVYAMQFKINLTQTCRYKCALERNSYYN